MAAGTARSKARRIHGTVRWDLFEEQEEALCRSNLTGVIETNDGAQIQFDSRGFFIKPDKSNPNKWITSASVYLHTADQRYEWLNTRLAVWVGEFDMETLPPSLSSLRPSHRVVRQQNAGCVGPQSGSLIALGEMVSSANFGSLRSTDCATGKSPFRLLAVSAAPSVENEIA